MISKLYLHLVLLKFECMKKSDGYQLKSIYIYNGLRLMLC